MPRLNNQKASSGTSTTSKCSMPNRITDPRFTNTQTSAIYRLSSRKHTRVSIDSRIAHVLRDERFTHKAKVDRYGRRLRDKAGKTELERLYHIEDSSSKFDTEPEDDIADDDEGVEAELRRLSGAYDPAREGGFSESSSEDESAGESVEEGTDEHPNQQGENVPAGEVSARIALVNLDWDNIRAVDLMAVVSSFLPTGGQIKRISVYPSEFGKERMEKEESEGPPGGIFVGGKDRSSGEGNAPAHESSEEDEDELDEEKIKQSIIREDRGEEFDAGHLRQYQLERLRYYYAVLTCSSSSCAEAIYNAIDGTEYLSSANFFDLRFIPDDVSFDEDTPRDECEQVPSNYRPSEFVTDVLQHSKPKLTWDADDVKRKEAQRRAFSGSLAEADDDYHKAYLGSDSEHSDDDGDERRRKRALLGFGDEVKTGKAKAKEPIGNMQVTFTPGLSESEVRASIDEVTLPEETSVQKYIRKEKERKARRKQKSELNRTADLETTSNAIQLPELQEADSVDRGFEDPFFTAPDEDKRAEAKQRKSSKQQRAAEHAAREANVASNRAETELLMMDENSETRDISHFDMNQVEKVGKAARKKKGKRNRLSARDKDAVSEHKGDTFVVDVDDPRFKAIHEINDFAIDPHETRFRGTEGDRALQESTRRKRASLRAVEDDGHQDKRRKHKQGDAKEDLPRLITKVRGRIDT